MIRVLASALVALAIAMQIAPVRADVSLTLAEQATLQAAMQRHVEASSIDGAVLYLDRETGEARPLHPVTAHPMILSYGEHFVLCFDFRDASGKNVPIDYYMARRGNGYVVFHTAVADRTLLKELMADGRVKRLK